MSTRPSRILVTGGTGFIGAYVVDLLLERGIVVVVTARSESKARDFTERRSRFKDLLEVVITGDLTAIGAFDDLAKDVDVIIHCASPLPNEPITGSTPQKSIIDPAISGTLSILQAARKSPTLKRLVLTSSTAAVYDVRNIVPGDRHTADDWHPITYEEGTKTNDPVIGYWVSKKYAELEAWAEVDPTSKHLDQLKLDPSYQKNDRPTTNPAFDLTVICPPIIFGPWVHPLGPSGLDSMNDSNLRFRDLVRGDYRTSHPPVVPTPVWVDVRDVAFAHVEAALRLDRSEHPSISNKRYTVCSSEKFNYHMAAEIMREEFPEWADQVLPPREEMPPHKDVSVDGTPTTRDLGVKYGSFRESTVDLVRQLRMEVLRDSKPK